MLDAIARMDTQESPVVSENNNDDNNAKRKSRENRHNSAFTAQTFTPRALGVHNFYIC